MKLFGLVIVGSVFSVILLGWIWMFMKMLNDVRLGCGGVMFSLNMFLNMLL